MTVAMLLPGHVVWTKGNEFGDARKGGCVVRRADDPETGEAFVLVLTDSPAKVRQDSLILHRAKGGYDSLGLVARLERIAIGDLDPHATDDFRAYRKVWRFAIAALRAASLPPNDHLGSRGHDDLITAYRELRSTAEMLERNA
jgi:hypothetical protein